VIKYILSTDDNLKKQDNQKTKQKFQNSIAITLFLWILINFFDYSVLHDLKEKKQSEINSKEIINKYKGKSIKEIIEINTRKNN
jgi:hypothetical protein